MYPYIHCRDQHAIRQSLAKSLDKIDDRWHDAGTKRKQINACRAALELLEYGHQSHNWAPANPKGIEMERWSNRLAMAEGRPRSLPRIGARIIWASDKDLKKEEIVINLY